MGRCAKAQRMTRVGPATRPAPGFLRKGETGAAAAKKMLSKIFAKKIQVRGKGP